MHYILHLFLGLVAGILVTIPLGPVNLLVVNTMASKNLRAAMVLPFWIFIVAYCESTVGFDFSISTVGLFLAGVFSGRYGTLWMYARLSQYVSERSSVIELWLDRVIAALFLVLALIQSLRILVHYG